MSLAVVVEVGLVAVVDSSFESIGGHFVTGGSGDQGMSDVPDFEDGWGFDGIPIFFGEWVDDLLLASFFGAFCESLVLAYGHGCRWSFGSEICKFDLRL